MEHADEGGRERRGDRCAECSSSLAPGQRYCLECGARSTPLPAEVAERVASLLRRGAEAAAVGRAATAGEGDGPRRQGEPQEATGESALEQLMRRPQAAASALMAVLAFGVIVGTVTGPLAQSAGIVPVVVQEEGGEPLAAREAAPQTAETVAGAAAPFSVPAQVPAAAPAPAPLEAPSYGPPPSRAPPELPPEEVLPPITHVFLIVLGDHGYEEVFGPQAAESYLGGKLREEGELLPNYYAVTAGDLANEIALVSGQGPTQETAADCPTYAEIASATVAEAEQVVGSGCVYPAQAMTLGGQLAAAGMKWRAYVEGQGDGGAGCRHPALGEEDPDHAAGPGDPFVTWRNPFLYFHSVIDGGECAEAVVGLNQMSADLRTAQDTPALSYIAPDACHAGDEAACEAGAPAGLAATDGFLETVVPEIMGSDSYRTGGLIAITFAQAPQGGPAADADACCATPAYPNLPAPEMSAGSGPVKESGGGGRVGLLLLSPYVEAGAASEAGYYNHYSLLRSIEELFGLSALGYAAEPAVTPFDETVYSGGES